MTTTLTDIQDECRSYGEREPEYVHKMMHKVPDAVVMDKMQLLKDMCRDKVVLSLGCTGQYQEVVDSVCKKCYGIDKEPQERGLFFELDLDSLDRTLPKLGDIDLVWAGEVLEHLTNPGNLLRNLRQYKCTILITVPNALCEVGMAHMRGGVENVNIDHVAYYSYWTLKGLVEKCGYAVREFYWYDGKPMTAEGLIMVVE